MSQRAETKTDRLYLTIEPSLMERSQRIADRFPEYEGKRAVVVRHAMREFLDKKERELAERELVTTDSDLRVA